MAEYSVIGKAGNKEKNTLIKKMTGTWDYAGDNFPGKKLICRTVLSNFARGKIKSIDTSAAERLAGVKAVTTYADCPVLKQGITWWGQEVCAIAAVDEETANQAVELVKVEYEPGTAVTDPDEASKPGAPLTGVWPDTNVRTAQVVRGDSSAGFKEADVIVEDTVGWLNRWQHMEIEPRTALAYWVGDHLYFWTSSQNAFGQRSAAGASLKIPLNKIHLVSHGSGSGHGDKHTIEYGVIAAVLAKKAGMPVLYQLSRREHVINAIRQHAAKGTVKIGVKKDGTITALECTMYGDAGGNGAAWAAGLHWMLRSTYKCPNGLFKSVDIASNTPPTGAFRCVADPPGCLIMNQVVDMTAYQLGMDPLAFRLKNAVPPELPHQDTKLPYGGHNIPELFRMAANGIGWSAKYHAPGQKTLPDGRLHGVGIAGGIDVHGQLSAPVGAVVHLTRDGKATTNHGQTFNTFSVIAECHILAQTLGMAYDDVQIGSIGETDTSSEGGSEGGSTRTITLGAAFQMAAEDALDQAKTVAAGANLLNVSKDRISVADGKFFETANPANSKTWAQVAAAFTNPIIGRGYTWAKKYRRPKFGLPVGTDCETRGSEATAVEVAVDPETGEVEVLDICNAIDMGQVVYRRGVEKQMFGGLEIILGQALWYDHIIERSTGATLNPSFLEHKMPTSLDIPHSALKIAMQESDDVAGPYGAHGIGEPCVTSYAALNAAVYNATGKWIKESPITPMKVLQALGKA